MSNPGPGPIPARNLSAILAKSTNYEVTAADLSLGSLVLKMNAGGGALTVTIRPTLGNSSESPTVYVLKDDATANIVSISNGSAVVDNIFAPSTPAGQIGGYRVVVANGTVISSMGIG